MTSLDQRCVNTIRILSADCVEKARSGHPGMPMGAAAMAYVLWTRFLKYNPSDPMWPGRDRFVLSAGHGSALLYSILHLTGYDLSIEELKNFRQWESRTPGHPEYGHTPGVETTTGPLGQGFANGVGMALAARYLGAKFNRTGHEIINHRVFGIVSDGDLMEGVSHEAASIAGHLKLGNLIYLYDDNHISIEGNTTLTFSDDSIERFRSYGWHVTSVEDGNDMEEIASAIISAERETLKPSLIAVHTHIGFGSPNKQDQASAHGEPLGTEELELTKKHLGWTGEPFHVPEDVREHFRKTVDKGLRLQEEWRFKVKKWRDAYPELSEMWRQWMSGELPTDWNDAIPVFDPDPKGAATRVSSGKVLNSVAQVVGNLVGGSADLAPSNKTLISGEKDFQPPDYMGRNIRFGVREHAMASIVNGIALHGGIMPYCGTFLVFSDYMRPAIRLAALMNLEVIYIFTHDSIGLGEDGPTHQAVEHLASLRAIPGLTVIRPCDANETAEAWRTAVDGCDGPVALALTRQGVPTLDRSGLAEASNLSRGAYVIKEASNGNPAAVLIGTGSEVHIALEAAELLEAENIPVRVVSMPSWELFEAQPEDYRESVLPPTLKAKVAVEAGVSQGWHKYVGAKGKTVSVDRFGASAPYKEIYANYGITPAGVVEAVKSIL
ncbi:MAG: transketolase [Desulfatiglandaceae bacterium]